MSAIERAATIIDREYGPCNDDVNHRGTEAHHAAEALAEAGLLITDEDRAVLDAAALYAESYSGTSVDMVLYRRDVLLAAVRARREEAVEGGWRK